MKHILYTNKNNDTLLCLILSTRLSCKYYYFIKCSLRSSNLPKGGPMTVRAGVQIQSENPKCHTYSVWPWSFQPLLFNDFSEPYFKSHTLTSQWFSLRLFDFMMMWKRYVFCKNDTSNLEFWSFPRHWAMFPASQAIMNVNNWCTYDHSVPRQPFCFSLLVQCSIHCMRSSALHYKRGFVLDDFAEL